MTTSIGNIRMETAPDGTQLRIGCWRTDGEAAGTVVLVHGRTEFLEKYAEVIGELNARNLDVWAMDWRGQGLSDRMLGHRQKGHIDRFEAYVDDLAWFVDKIVGIKSGPVVLLAHSMGGHVAIRAVLEGLIEPDGLVATAPMIALPMGPLGSVAATGLSSAVSLIGFGGRYGPGMSDHDPDRVKFDGNTLTGDRARFDRFHSLLADNPDLALGGVTWGWLSAAFRSMSRIRKLSRNASTACPGLICTPMADRVVSVTAQSEFCAAIAGWEQVRFDDARHELLMETDAIRDRFWFAFDGFLRTI